MANKAYSENSVENIANSIRAKKSEDEPCSVKWKIKDMDDAISSIKSYNHYQEKFVMNNIQALRMANGWDNTLQDDDPPGIYVKIGNRALVYPCSNRIKLKCALKHYVSTSFKISRIAFDGGNCYPLLQEPNQSIPLSNGTQIPEFVGQDANTLSLSAAANDGNQRSADSTATNPQMWLFTYNSQENNGTTDAGDDYVITELETDIMNKKISLTGIDVDNSILPLVELFSNRSEISLSEIFTKTFDITDFNIPWYLDSSIKFNTNTADEEWMGIQSIPALSVFLNSDYEHKAYLRVFDYGGGHVSFEIVLTIKSCGTYKDPDPNEPYATLTNPDDDPGCGSVFYYPFKHSYTIGDKSCIDFVYYIVTPETCYPAKYYIAVNDDDRRIRHIVRKFPSTWTITGTLCNNWANSDLITVKTVNVNSNYTEDQLSGYYPINDGYNWLYSNRRGD